MKMQLGVPSSLNQKHQVVPPLITEARKSIAFKDFLKIYPFKGIVLNKRLLRWIRINTLGEFLK